MVEWGFRLKLHSSNPEPLKSHLGQSLPMRSAQVSHHVRVALKADVTGRGVKRKNGYVLSRATE
jgi:hypothetical protein